MARESTITQEQVNSVADAIRAGGNKPTARAVRDKLGSGSMATVLKLLQVWQAGQVPVARAAIALPQVLQNYLVDFVGQEVARGREDVEAELVSLQQSQADLIAENERQASTIELQVEALESAQAETSTITGKLAQVESDLSRALDDLAGERSAAENARTELAKAQLRLENVPRIEAEVERLRAALESEQQQRIAAEQSAAVLTAKLEAAQARATDLTERERVTAEKLTAATQTLERTQADLNQARSQAQSLQATNDVLTRDLEAVRSSAADARTAAEKTIDGLSGKVDTLSGKLEAAQVEAKGAVAEAAELRGKLAKAEKPTKG